MKTEKDILKDNPRLKGMPFSTPEGYFDELKSQMKVCSRPEVVHRPAFRRFSPQIALAAAFALLLAVGGFFLERKNEMNFSEEDYIVFSEDLTNTIIYDADDLYADVATEDDIMEYLIYSDIDSDELY